ncbi:MAG: site-2 protease family protein [Bacillota bacterium]
MKGIHIFHIEMKIHPLFFLCFFIFFIFGYGKTAAISFLVVLLHEGAHTLIAEILGYTIVCIEILPFGGVAKIQEFVGVNPRHEVLIAAAGPTMNFLLVLTAYYLGQIFHLYDSTYTYFLSANLVVGIFNLIPIMPLDGGRIIRAYLAYLIGLKHATRFVVALSKLFCCIIFVVGIYLIRYNYLNMLMSLTAIFLYIAACRESDMAAIVFMKEVIEKKQFLLAKGILDTKTLVALESTTLNEVLNRFIPRKYHIITVMDKDCNIKGVITEKDVLEGMMNYGINVPLEKLLRNGLNDKIDVPKKWYVNGGGYK